MIEVKAKMVALDQNNHCVVVLTDLEETLMLPIWIGLLEAQSITMELTGEIPPRPLTHDLFIKLCGETDSAIDKVILTDLTEDIFMAQIHLICRGKETILDSRPSDAIALALRSGAKIYMDEKLMVYTHEPEDFLALEEDEESGHQIH